MYLLTYNYTFQRPVSDAFDVQQCLYSQEFTEFLHTMCKIWLIYVHWMISQLHIVDIGIFSLICNEFDSYLAIHLCWARNMGSNGWVDGKENKPRYNTEPQGHMDRLKERKHKWLCDIFYILDIFQVST